jgi:phosphoribosylformimino-5-aminoimidazole carboxamide ribotide isomerase
MKFRPCIDLHNGKVKQIVGGTLSDQSGTELKTNYEADRSAKWYAQLYRQDRLAGGHVIQLGPGNDQAAMAALAVWPGGLQLGGGVTIDNAPAWIDAGASAVIVTSWVFHGGKVDYARLKRLSQAIGRGRLVLDLSCRRREDAYHIVTDRWQTFTREPVTTRLLDQLSKYCAEYLIHAVDVEGKCQGIEIPLVELLGGWAGLPTTYAGGICTQNDIDTIARLGGGAIDFTVGSALDIFGGTGLQYQELAKRYNATIG